MNDRSSPQGNSAQPAETAASSKQSSSRRSSRHRHSRSGNKTLKLIILAWVLGALLLVTIIGWILTATKLSSNRSEYLGYQASVREELSGSKRLVEEIAGLERKVTDLEGEMATLVQGRIPGLNPLEFDLTVSLEQDYFKNISFTLTGTQADKKYEYRAVLHNGSPSVVRPNVTIFLFDARGVQVGKTQLSNDHATSEVEHTGLKPGETRAYSSRISLDRASDPAYFLIDVK